SCPFPLRRLERAKQPQVGDAEPSQLAQGIAERDLAITKASGPDVLVVARQRRGILREHRTDSIAGDQLGVREVLNDFYYRPLSRRFRAPQGRVVEAANPLVDPGDQLAQDGERIPVAQHAEDRLHVTRRRSRRRTGRVRKSRHRSPCPSELSKSGPLRRHTSKTGTASRSRAGKPSSRLHVPRT